MKVLSDYDPEKKKKQSPFYRPPTLLSRSSGPEGVGPGNSGPGDFSRGEKDNPARRMAQQVAEQKRMNFLSSARLTAEEEFGKAEGSWRESVMGDGSDAGVQPLLDQFNKTAERLLAKAPDDRAKAFVNDSLYGMKMRYAQQADEFTLGKVKEQAGGLLENSLGQSLKQAQSAGPENLAAIHQNALTTIHAYGLNGLALDQNTAEARKQKFTSDFWEGAVRDRAMADPDQAQQLLDSSRDNLAPEALERAELSLNVGRAERTRKERAAKLNTDRQAGLLFGNRRETLLGIAETGMDDGSMEKRFTELGREDLANSWRKERNAAVKLHSFFRETDGTPLLEQARQLGKKFKSSASEGAPGGAMDFALSALRKRAENFTRDPVGQMAARVQETLGPQANPGEALRMNQRLQRETAKGLPGFRPRVMARDNARQYREMYEEQGGQGRMDVLRGLEPLPTAYRRQALAEAVPGVMPQVAHLAMENGRSSRGDMTLWLQAHRPKTGKLDGEPEIEREALANLETSDVFRAVTAPLRMGGGRQGELMLDEFRRGAARYGRLRNDPMAGVRFLEENVRTLQSEGLAEIYWPADKSMPGDLEGRLSEKREEILDRISMLPSEIRGPRSPGKPLPDVENPSQLLPGHTPDGELPSGDSKPSWWNRMWPRPDGTVSDLAKPLSGASAQPALPFIKADKPTWINAPDGDGYILVGPNGEFMVGPKGDFTRYRPWEEDQGFSRWTEPEIQYLSSDSGDSGGSGGGSGGSDPALNTPDAAPKPGQGENDPDSDVVGVDARGDKGDDSLDPTAPDEVEDGLADGKTGDEQSEAHWDNIKNPLTRINSYAHDNPTRDLVYTDNEDVRDFVDYLKARAKEEFSENSLVILHDKLQVNSDNEKLRVEKIGGDPKKSIGSRVSPPISRENNLHGLLDKNNETEPEKNKRIEQENEKTLRDEQLKNGEDSILHKVAGDAVEKLVKHADPMEWSTPTKILKRIFLYFQKYMDKENISPENVVNDVLDTSKSLSKGKKKSK